MLRGKNLLRNLFIWYKTDLAWSVHVPWCYFSLGDLNSTYLFSLHLVVFSSTDACSVLNTMVLFIVRWTGHWQLAFEHLDCSKPIDLLVFSFKRRYGWLWGHWFIVGQWLVFGPSTKLFFAITRSLSFSPGSSVYWTIKQSTPHLSGSTADCSDTVVTLMNDIRICMSDRSKRNARLFLRSISGPLLSGLSSAIGYRHQEYCLSRKTKLFQRLCGVIESAWSLPQLSTMWAAVTHSWRSNLRGMDGMQYNEWRRSSDRLLWEATIVVYTIFSVYF